MSAAARGCCPSRWHGWARGDRVDAAPEMIEVAKRACGGQGLDIDYRAVGVEAVEGRFDLVICDGGDRACRRPAAFVDDLAARLAPDGLLILSTPNKTAWSKLLTITLAEGLGADPQGNARLRDVHSIPTRCRGLLAQPDWSAIDFEGIA